MLTITTHHEQETQELGKMLAQFLFPGAFVALRGDLGAGKTAFARGVGEGLGIDEVASPTFTILQEHAGRLPLYHFDAYRLHSGDELYDIGYADIEGGVVLMEWPEHVVDALPKEMLTIAIEGNGNAPRVLCFTPCGQKYEALVRAVEGEHADTCV